MSELISFVHIVPKPGVDAEGELEPLLHEFVAGSKEKDAPGSVPSYRYYRGEDGTYRVYERYASSEAFLAHAEQMDPSLVERLTALADLPEIEVLGDPTPEAKAACEAFGATFRTLVVGV